MYKLAYCSRTIFFSEIILFSIEVSISDFVEFSLHMEMHKLRAAASSSGGVS